MSDKIYVVQEDGDHLELEEWNEKNPPLMLCGHSAQAISDILEKETGKKIWCCVICEGRESRVINKKQLNLSNRKARCTYFKGCGSEVQSSLSLAFFCHQPEEEFDEYYCGCMGWD